MAGCKEISPSESGIGPCPPTEIDIKLYNMNRWVLIIVICALSTFKYTNEVFKARHCKWRGKEKRLLLLITDINKRERKVLHLHCYFIFLCQKKAFQNWLSECLEFCLVLRTIHWKLSNISACMRKPSVCLSNRFSEIAIWKIFLL